MILSMSINCINDVGDDLAYVTPPSISSTKKSELNSV